jgi:hypothetical protein
MFFFSRAYIKVSYDQWGFVALINFDALIFYMISFDIQREKMRQQYCKLKINIASEEFYVVLSGRS